MTRLKIHSSAADPALAAGPNLVSQQPTQLGREHFLRRAAPEPLPQQHVFQAALLFREMEDET